MLIRDVLGHYRPLNSTIEEQDILDAAEAILRQRVEREGVINSPAMARQWLQTRLAPLANEEFHVVWLDTRHRILTVEKLFSGSIAGCEVHPRVVAQAALKHNASACILAHNHPSGNPEPSMADRHLTARLKETLSLFDVRLIDHIVVGAEGSISMAEKGWV